MGTKKLLLLTDSSQKIALFKDGSQEIAPVYRWQPKNYSSLQVVVET
jgi:hypothetical protein